MRIKANNIMFYKMFSFQELLVQTLKELFKAILMADFLGMLSRRLKSKASVYNRIAHELNFASDFSNFYQQTGGVAFPNYNKLLRLLQNQIELGVSRFCCFQKICKRRIYPYVRRSLSFEPQRYGDQFNKACLHFLQFAPHLCSRLYLAFLYKLGRRVLRYRALCPFAQYFTKIFSPDAKSGSANNTYSCQYDSEYARLFGLSRLGCIVLAHLVTLRSCYKISKQGVSWSQRQNLREAA